MQKRYWLRGGILGVFLIAVMSVGLAFSGILYIPDNPFYWIVNLVVTNYDGSPYLGAIFWMVYILESFIFGSVLGWLYGKIKNRSIPNS